MFKSRCAIVALLASALLPANVYADEGKRDTSSIVVKGVRDPSAWFRIESQHMIVYSNDDPDDVPSRRCTFWRAGTGPPKSLIRLLSLSVPPMVVCPRRKYSWTVCARAGS